MGNSNNIIENLARMGIVPFYSNGKVYYDFYGQTFDSPELAIYYAQ
jgi:hypothetical protein